MDKKYKFLFDYIEKTYFKIDYRINESSSYEKFKIGAYLLEFNVYYNQVEKNYVSSDYLQPEECDIEYIPYEIDNVNVYVNNKIQELTDEIYDQLTNLLYIKIIHNK